jgi:ferric-dicitrate binding protein FerR (iron transport regulator)
MLERLIKATRPPVRRLPLFRYGAAAAVILGIAVAIFLPSRRHKQQPAQSPAENLATTPIPPGGNKASLTLAGGRIILLDSIANGQLAVQGSTTITKNDDGQISYNAAGAAIALENTLTTPRGGQFQLTLPEGTKVWINAASSITYPTAFTGKERKVTIKGEAYFEVAQNKNQPFIVQVQDGPQVEVLGTNFNINAYTDEPSIRTTLVSGSVKVRYKDRSLLLKPSQQALLTRQQQLALDTVPDIDEVLAWRNGFFAFNKAPLEIVLRQLSRWYNVDIVYSDGVPAIRFEGEMKRDLNLSEVLNILRKMEVHCKMDGRRLIVLP